MTEQIKLLPRRFARTILVAFSLVLALGGFVPAAVAEDCTPVKSAPTGIQKPTGADSVTYTYNPCTGLWANDYYTWSPATRRATPVTPLIYIYNPTTGKYEAKKWVYSPANGWYRATVAVTTPPAEAKVVGAPPAAQPSQPLGQGQQGKEGSSNANDPANSNGADDAAGDSGNSNSVPASVQSDQPAQQAGLDSDNSSTSGGQSNSQLQSSTSTSLDNKVIATTTSGDASVIANTKGGNATTGNATTSATVVNQVQSTSSLSGAVTFTANINGDVNGDLLIDPSQIQPAASGDSLKQSGDITVNSTNDASINNDINLSSTSGDATVSKNTKAGDATSGDATTIANVINLMNTLVSSGQSFIGTININGNLRGNILVPKDFYNSLIASNAPRQVVKVPNSTLENSGIVLNNNQTITNAVSSTAVSGTATSSQNTKAGDATSGQAATNVTIFDLTNYQVQDKNSLLVFVNVTGKWVGVIMDAPAGSTAALFGSNVTRGPPASDFQVDSNNNQSINNNITVAAASGDATVSKNTRAGDATSGNAYTAVNLLNMTGSYFSASNFFGILFINVFGNWYGDFGVAKPALTPTPKHNSSTSGGTPTKKPDKTFKFEPARQAGKVTQNYMPDSSYGGNAPSTYYSSHITPMLAAVARNIVSSSNSDAAARQGGFSSTPSIFLVPRSNSASLSSDPGHSKANSSSDIAGVALVLGGAVILGVERLSGWRHKHAR